MWHDDPKVLFPLQSQTTEHDRHWLAALFGYTRRHNPYRYVEVGSYLGGTLTPALMDERCRGALSIDLRPAVQPDARSVLFDYRRATTAVMRERLLRTAGLDTAKLVTFDGAAADCDFGNQSYELAFIDAEHTDEAVFADFLAVYPRLARGAVCAFHDSNLVTAGLENVQAFLRYAGRPHWFAVFCDSSVSAVFLDTAPGDVPENLRAGRRDWKEFKDRSRDELLREIIRLRCDLPEVTLREKPVIGN